MLRTLLVNPEYKSGQLYISLEVEFSPPSTSLHREEELHHRGRFASSIEDTSSSTLDQRYCKVHAGRVVLSFITQSPFQMIKRGAQPLHEGDADEMLTYRRGQSFLSPSATRKREWSTRGFSR